MVRAHRYRYPAHPVVLADLLALLALLDLVLLLVPEVPPDLVAHQEQPKLHHP